jgi:hypothetical protein
MCISSVQRVLHDLKRTRLSRRRIIWLLVHPLTSQQVVCFSQYSCVSLVEKGGGRGGSGAKSCDGEEAWSSKNPSVLSASVLLIAKA